MDNESRIAELEHENAELRARVHALESAAPEGLSVQALQLAREWLHPRFFFEPSRKRAGWRLSVRRISPQTVFEVFVLCALLFGSVFSLNTLFASGKPLYAVLPMLCVAAVLVVGYAFVFSRHGGALPRVVIAWALCILYYAAARQLPSNHIGAGVLVVLLILIALLMLRRGDEITGAFFLGLVYYGVGYLEPRPGLAIVALVPFIILLWQSLVGWRLATLVGIVGSYCVLPGLSGKVLIVEGIPVTQGALTFCFLVFSLACVLETHKSPERRHDMTLAALVNTLAFCWYAWPGLRESQPYAEWAFRLSIAFVTVLFAVASETTGRTRNTLFAMYAGLSVALVGWFLEEVLPGIWFPVGLAGLSFGLVLLYRWSGMAIIKIIEHVLLCATCVGTLAAIKSTEFSWDRGVVFSADWMGLGLCAGLFLLCAWVYERHMRSWPTERRHLSGQWYLTGSWFDIRPGTAALFHSAAAALLFLAFAILEMGDDLRLPFALGLGAVVFATLGFLLRTPQIEVGGVLLLVAAHACYHVMGASRPDFKAQPYFESYTLALAFITYFGGYVWEHYLSRFSGGRAWEHYLIAALPPLAATYLLSEWLGVLLPPEYIPSGRVLLGLCVLGIGYAVRAPALKASGVLALALGGAATFYQMMPWWLIAPTVLAYFFAERIVVLGPRRAPRFPLFERGLGAFCVLGGAVTAGVLLHGVLSPPAAGAAFIALGIVLCLLALMFKAVRYAWVGLLVLSATISYALTLNAFGATLVVRIVLGAMGVSVVWAAFQLLRFAQNRPTSDE